MVYVLSVEHKSGIYIYVLAIQKYIKWFVGVELYTMLYYMSCFDQSQLNEKLVCKYGVIVSKLNQEQHQLECNVWLLDW